MDELTIFLYVHRYLHERHEQSKQDLKGLEETVVRGYLLVTLWRSLNPLMPRLQRKCLKCTVAPPTHNTSLLY